MKSNHTGFTLSDVAVAVKWVEAIGIKLYKTAMPEPSFTEYGKDDGYIDICVKTSPQVLRKILSEHPDLILENDWSTAFHWTTARFGLRMGLQGYVVISFDSQTDRSTTIRIFSHMPDGRHLM